MAAFLQLGKHPPSLSLSEMPPWNWDIAPMVAISGITCIM
jgi:hypothetical protein